MARVEQQELLPGFPVITSYTIESGSHGYLVRKPPKKRKVAHLWNGKDTVCRMATTGGLALAKYHVVDSVHPDEPICHMCLVNSAKNK